MKNINLLPAEKKPSGAIIKFSKVLKEISTVTVVILFVAAAVVTALYFSMNRRIKSEQSKQNTYKNEIKSLEQTEQQLVFTKDRLTKIDSLLKNNDAREEIVVLDQISNSLFPGIVLTGSDLTADLTSITVVADSSVTLSKFIDQLINSDYSKIDLIGFTYTPEKGYEVSFGIKI